MQAALIETIEAKNLEIMNLKQQLAGVTEELAAAADFDVHLFIGLAAGGGAAETGRMQTCLPGATRLQGSATAPVSLEDNKQPSIEDARQAAVTQVA